MKILHCVHLDIPGGKENHLYRCRKFEIEKGDPWKHEILHTGDKIHAKFVNFFQKNYKVYEYKTFKSIKIPRFIRPALLRKNFDFSHDVNLFYEIQDMRLMNLFERFAKGKNVFHDGGHSWFLNSEETQWINKFDFYFSNAKASKTMLHKRWRVPENKIKIIHNSFLPEYAVTCEHTGKEEIEKLKKRYNLGGEKVVLYVGRFVTLKGIHSLIEALDFLPEKGLKLVLVGDGKTRRLMEDLVKQKNKKDKVIFTGLQTDTAPFYKIADVTVVPSAREPFGNVNLEAGYAGSPIIASKIDGIPEIIPDDDFGYLLKPKVKPSNYCYLDLSSLPKYVIDPETQELMEPKFLDPEELAETISLVVGKESERAREKAQYLKKRIKEEFSMEKRSVIFKRIVKEIT